MPQQDLDFYYDDSKKMVLNWLHTFLKEDPKDLRPLTEVKLESETHNVYAIADIITNAEGIPYIRDYKTSKSMEMTADYRLQLAILALCFNERRNNLNFKVGNPRVFLVAPPISRNKTQLSYLLRYQPHHKHHHRNGHEHSRGWAVA